MTETAEHPASRKVLDALERVFAAEIDGRLPFQSKARIYKELCDDGMVQPMERTFGHGWSAATVRGYELTQAGRMLYCASCDDGDVT